MAGVNMLKSRLSLALSGLRGGSTKARALRGSGVTIFHVVASNVLRLLSNLVLTRLLFPEAFGLMALMMVFIVGLKLFSDLGIDVLLIQHRRGTDRAFLDTAWTLQILRGGLLWLVACAIAYPVAAIYEQPQIAAMLPVLSLILIIEGFKTTKEAEANRELRLERVVALDLASQVIGLVIMALLAFLLRSVWAVVFGTLVMSALRVAAFHAFLPGGRNRLHWDMSIVREAFGFGSFIFLSTICTFLVNMGGRFILGAHVDIGLFGVFSIAEILGTAPGLIGMAIAQKVIFPLYRIKPPQESAENRRNLFKARRMAASLLIAMLGVLAFIGDWLVQLLYDPRYALAGPMVVLFALSWIPSAALAGSNQVLLGFGDSKRHFFLMAAMAAVQITLSLVGVLTLGLAGVILAHGLTILLTYPLRVWLISRYDAWDPKGEFGLMGLGFAITGLACWLQWDSLSALW
ncbi:oligosaccharide flippase family protein [Rhodovulum marinum]|uniref:O-antigen/teichoic acid export membrane protein n=1 Tax=Rhodovulum marinum TaxID=320662 RepID=A0A4R2PUD4_9RHOB|nr:oligosaccharide flippase family protein [Rhodovulum marinum]TCP39529.1 O-antigen/teichoic acid export membrane protein [Rhodovulum marinum]